MAQATVDEEQRWRQQVDAWRRDKDAFFRSHPESPLPESARPRFAGLA